MFKIFTQTSSSQLKEKGKAMISLGFSGGIMRFNEAAKDALKLNVGDRFAIIQSENSPKDWFLAAHDEGLPLRGHKSKQDMHLQCISVIRTIIKNIDEDAPKNMRLLLSTEPQELEGTDITQAYAIITSSYSKPLI